jgi:hypothetical protein
MPGKATAACQNSATMQAAAAFISSSAKSWHISSSAESEVAAAAANDGDGDDGHDDVPEDKTWSRSVD